MFASKNVFLKGLIATCLVLTGALCMLIWSRSTVLKVEVLDKFVIQQKLKANEEISINRLLHHVRLACWIATHPSNLNTRLPVVRATWAKRCDRVVYVSSKANESLGIVALPVKDGREHLTAKSNLAFKYMFDHYGSQYDWFLKADDDTYVFVENLKRLLLQHSPTKPIYFGHRFNMIVKGGYFSGGAGYVLSSEALKRFVGSGDTCRQDGGDEDVEVGKCMHKIGVELGMSEDSKGRSRFHCFNPTVHIQGNWTGPVAWYKKAYRDNKGIESMSDYPISFHYIDPPSMYLLEYLAYRVQLFGEQDYTLYPVSSFYSSVNREEIIKL